MSMVRIYVAGPYTCGSNIRNIRNAMLIATSLRAEGWHPIVPHMSGFQDMLFPESYETWMAECLDDLATCQVMVRLPGHSPGADREQRLAEEEGIPVIPVSAQLVSKIRSALA